MHTHCLDLLRGAVQSSKMSEDTIINVLDHQQVTQTTPYYGRFAYRQIKACTDWLKSPVIFPPAESKTGNHFGERSSAGVLFALALLSGLFTA